MVFLIAPPAVGLYTTLHPKPSNSVMTQILIGATLQRALNATSAPVRLFQGKDYVRDLTADEVPLLIADGRFEFIGNESGSRVRYARQLDPSAIIQIPWKPHFEQCWLNTQAACQWPWVESRGVPLALDGRAA